MATITGTVKGLIDAKQIAATLDVALCGYASQIPRGEWIYGQATQNSIAVDPNTGAFTFDVVGNDEIIPPGTYYTVTMRDDNGDILQVNAYIFAEAQSYNLGDEIPFDPSLGVPPSPAPPAITSQLLTVGYSSVPEFPGNVYASWQITLTGDAAPIFDLLIDGNLYTIRVLQDATGGHAFNWPSNVNNAASVDPAPNSGTIQTFMAVANKLYSIAPATYYP